MPPNNQYIPPTQPGTQPGLPQQPQQSMPAMQQQAPMQPQMAMQPQDVGSGQPSTLPAPKNPNSTQSTLQLSEVRDNMVIMMDGTFRAVIACKSINFDLMSDREREGVEYSYQNFLNSLNFPIQILIRSERVDIGPYISQLVEKRRSQDNMLLGVLMDDYINFIDALAQEANIMEKAFYIVVPYFPLGDAANFVEQGKGFFGKLFGKQKTTSRIDSATYQKAKDEIRRRVDVIQAGLFQIGIQSTQLDTKSLGELYYNFYNPDTAVRQPLANFDDVTSLYTMKATPGQPQPGGPQ